MSPDYDGTANTVHFWVRQYFGSSGFTPEQLEELENCVDHICSEAINTYQTQINQGKI